jgi:hypothetical protein
MQVCGKSGSSISYSIRPDGILSLTKGQPTHECNGAQTGCQWVSPCKCSRKCNGLLEDSLINEHVTTRKKVHCTATVREKSFNRWGKWVRSSERIPRA